MPELQSPFFESSARKWQLQVSYLQFMPPIIIPLWGLSDLHSQHSSSDQEQQQRRRGRQKKEQQRHENKNCQRVIPTSDIYHPPDHHGRGPKILNSNGCIFITGGPRARQEDATSIARKYHNMVLGGKVRAAVRMVTNRGTGGAYRPFDLDSKSGRPVIEVLREKHPASRVPSEEDFDAHVGAPDCLDSMPVYCFEECVAERIPWC